MFDWNDLRFLIAVADGGSTLAASRALRVSQTTVARRLAALEASLGLTLLDRRQDGFRLTATGQDLLDKARTVAASAAEFEQAAEAQGRELGGLVRLTTEDVYGHQLIVPALVPLHEAHPAIRIELDNSRALRDLGAGEADIALRATSSEPPAGVVGRRLCRDDWTLYCSRDYARAHGVPRTKDELRQHALVGGGGGSLWRAYQAFLQRFDLEGSVAMHQGSSTGLLTSIRSGFGIGILPCIVADSEDDLIRCMPPMTDHGRDLWLLTHERVRDRPAVRTVVDFLYDRLKARVAALHLD